MKKIYFLALIGFSGLTFAQGSESFTNLNASASSYGGGSYSGDNGVTWTYSGARKVTSTDNVTGTSVGFDSSGTRNVKANSGANGVGTITYTVRSYFTAGTGANRTMAVYVNNIQVDTYSLAAMDTNYTRSVTVNTPGDVVIEFRSTGSRQIVLDDVSWTQLGGTLSANDLSKAKETFVKNTIVKNDEITFGADAKDMKVYNMLGQIVKTASVKENESVNVAELKEGNYIVTGVVNGKKVSQKIIKR